MMVEKFQLKKIKLTKEKMKMPGLKLKHATRVQFHKRLAPVKGVGLVTHTKCYVNSCWAKLDPLYTIIGDLSRPISQ
jgi:hypothetical protein